MAELFCAPPGTARQIEKQISPLIERAVTRSGDYTSAEIWSGLDDNSYQLWLISENNELLSIAITELRKQQKGLQCWVILVAGRKLKLWSGLIWKIEQFANDEGCVSVRWEGRAGWGRIFRDYRQVYVAYEKRLK